ncbi:MAG: sigma-70 family RNA polymerase sigma factor [Candidatus Eisenbacteria sp.]|nr:sigma-70 family RNA polymerase sigma factor [Candidatus Eisenbacteria bacterium]
MNPAPEPAAAGRAAIDETALIVRCQAGDRAAFEPIVTHHMRRAAAFALAWTGNAEDALDLSQEAFVRAFRAISRFDPARPFYPWFYRILRNLCWNHLGRAARLHEVPLRDDFDRADARPRPDAQLERQELRASVWEALRKLKPNDREILILREFQGLTYAEIAAVLGIPQGTVMSRLHQARRRLRERLQPVIGAAAGRRAES